MDKPVLYSYSIMNLDTAHLDEICEDIKNQVETTKLQKIQLRQLDKEEKLEN